MLEDLKFKQLGRDDKVLSEEEQRDLLSELCGWEIREDKNDGHAYLHKAFTFGNFQLALDFVNLIGALAEEVNHHPQLTLGWGNVEISWWTHSLNGLHQNDFILADTSDKLRRS